MFATFVERARGDVTYSVLTGQRAALALATELWGDVNEAFHDGFFPPDLAVAHYRGMLAQAGGDLDEAETHYRHAIADHEAIGSQPHLVASQRALADLLATRGRASRSLRAAVAAM